MKADPTNSKRVGNTVGDHLGHRLAGLDRLSHVPFQQHAAHPLEILDVQRLVEAKTLAHQFKLRGGDVGVAFCLRERSTRAAHHQKQDHAKDQQERIACRTLRIKYLCIEDCYRT